MDDEQIVELYLSRDEAAISRTEEKYGGRLRGLAYGITGDISCAEECENDTYLHAWNSIPPSEPRKYFFAFLARITRNLSIDVCRRSGSLKRSAHIVELTAELEQCIPSQLSACDYAEGRELAGIISRWLHTLPSEARNIFVRRYWYLDSTASIAQRFNISGSKVKTSLFRSRNQLRKYLEKEDYHI